MIAKLDDGTHWAVSFDDRVTWTPIYVPAPNLNIEHTNVASADSGRTEDGVMHINWVRRDVKKVNLLYNAISGNEKEYMINLMQGKEFWFRYLDVTVKEIYAYTGENKYQYYSLAHYENEGGIFTNFSINVIEF